MSTSGTSLTGTENPGPQLFGKAAADQQHEELSIVSAFSAHDVLQSRFHMGSSLNLGPFAGP